MNRHRAVVLLVASALLVAGRAVAQDTSSQPEVQANVVNSGLQIFGGLGIPLGDFSDKDKGGAKTGYAAGAQYTISLGDAGEFFRNSGIVVCGTYTNNALDLGALSGMGVELESGPYSNIWALGGLKATLPSSESFSFDLAFTLGAVFSKSPEVNLSGGGITATMSGASATAFAWSATGELVIGKHFTAGIRYYEAKPKYKIEVRTEIPGFIPSTETIDAEQATSILVICVGYLF